MASLPVAPPGVVLEPLPDAEVSVTGSVRVCDGVRTLPGSRVEAVTSTWDGGFAMVLSAASGVNFFDGECGFVERWEVDTRRRVVTLPGRRLVASTRAGVEVWKGGERLLTCDEPTLSTPYWLSAAGGRIAGGMSDRGCMVWDADMGVLLAKLDNPGSNTRAVVLLDGRVASVRSSRQGVTVWSADFKHTSRIDFGYDILDMRATANGMAVSGGAKTAGFVALCEGPVLEEVVRVSVGRPVYRLAMLGASSFAASSYDGKVTFWRGSTLTGSFTYGHRMEGNGFRIASIGGGRVVAAHFSAVVLQSYPVHRLEAVQLLEALWTRYGGVPPAWLGALLGMLSLRRMCRVRGVDDVGMEAELVEPFGREVVMFL